MFCCVDKNWIWMTNVMWIMWGELVKSVHERISSVLSVDCFASKIRCELIWMVFNSISQEQFSRIVGTHEKVLCIILQVTTSKLPFNLTVRCINETKFLLWLFFLRVFGNRLRAFHNGLLLTTYDFFHSPTHSVSKNLANK